MSRAARIEAGGLLRRVQVGEKLTMPESRSLPVLDPRCHELRIRDIEKKAEWRVIYYVGNLAIAVLDIFRRRRGLPLRTYCRTVAGDWLHSSERTHHDENTAAAA
jgi:hypothetical protein